jgi:hypothetical protein
MQPRDGRYEGTIPGDYTDSPYPLQYFLELRGTARSVVAGGQAWMYPGFAPDLSNQPYYVVRAVELPHSNARGKDSTIR